MSSFSTVVGLITFMLSCLRKLTVQVTNLFRLEQRALFPSVPGTSALTDLLSCYPPIRPAAPRESPAPSDLRAFAPAPLTGSTSPGWLRDSLPHHLQVVAQMSLCL